MVKMIEDVMGSTDLQKLHEVRDKETWPSRRTRMWSTVCSSPCFTDGHVLLEANPGLGKTTLVKTFARALGLPAADNGRIQFTPDLMRPILPVP